MRRFLLTPAEGLSQTRKAGLMVFLVCVLVAHAFVVSFVDNGWVLYSICQSISCGFDCVVLLIFLILCQDCTFVSWLIKSFIDLFVKLQSRLCDVYFTKLVALRFGPELHSLHRSFRKVQWLELWEGIRVIFSCFGVSNLLARMIMGVCMAASSLDQHKVCFCHKLIKKRTLMGMDIAFFFSLL